MAKKSRSSARGASSRKSKPLRVRRRFSIFQLVIVAAIVVVVAAIAVVHRNQENSNALVLNTNNPPTFNVYSPYAIPPNSSGLTGTAIFSTTPTSAGTLSITGRGLPTSADISFGVTSTKATAVVSNGTRKLTVPVPLSATISGASRNTSGRRACNTAACNVDVSVKDSRGRAIAPSAVSNISFTPPNPTLEKVNVSGTVATVTGSGLSPKTRVSFGHYSVIGTAVDNGNGSQTMSVPLNVGKCGVISYLPFLNRLCHKVSAGTTTVQATVASGLRSNVGKVTLTSATSGGVNKISSGLNGPHKGQNCGDSSDGKGLRPGCGTPGGQGGCPPVGVRRDPNTGFALNGGGFCIGPGASICPVTKGNVTVLKPNGGETWNYGSNFLFSWKNGGKKVIPPTPNPSGDSHSGAFAQVTLCGKTGWYFVAHCGTNGMTQGESCPGDGKHGYTNGLLCFAVLAKGDRYNDPNVGKPGATIKVNIPGCVFGAPPNGLYKAYLQVEGLTEPQMCLHLQNGEKRCTGLPARITSGASDLSNNWFTITGSSYVNPGP